MTLHWYAGLVLKHLFSAKKFKRLGGLGDYFFMASPKEGHPHIRALWFGNVSYLSGPEEG